MRSSFVSLDWVQTPEGQGILAHLVDQVTGHRKLYGALERPNLPPTVEQIHFKIFLSGRSGVGKSSLVSYLAGQPSWAAQHHGETPGIRTTRIYWPTRIQSSLILFELSLWDAGDVAVKKYGHILPVCRERSDAGIFVFSFADRNSFEDLDSQLSSSSRLAIGVVPIVVGLKYDAATAAGGALEVNPQSVANFESKWNVRVLRIQSPQNNGSPPPFGESSAVLNLICDQLWAKRAQRHLHQRH